MKSFAYARVTSVEDAQALLAERGARLLAGGTDLLALLKERIVEPDRLVDISGVKTMRGIETSRDGVRIGALATLADVMAHDAVPPILKESLAEAATPQLRNVATVGGNLLQRNRCWYFRGERHHCWLKGGQRCLAVDGENRYHAIFGDGECRAVTPSDLAPALVALDATVLVRRADGEERRMPVAELFAPPASRRRREHTLADGDVLLETRIDADALKRRGAYLKFMDRAAWSFALASVAASARLVDGKARDVRVVAGGVAIVPWRVSAAEELLEGEPLDDSRALAAAERFVRDARPLRDNAYKVQILRELVRRALLRLVA